MNWIGWIIVMLIIIFFVSYFLDVPKKLVGFWKETKIDQSEIEDQKSEIEE